MDPEPGPSGLSGFDADPGGFDGDPGDISSLMEATLAEEDDYDGQMLEVEPELYIDSNCDDGETGPSFMDAFGDASWAMDDSSNFSTGSKASATNGMTAAAVTSGGGRGNKVQLGPNCPICGQTMHKQHSRDHVSW